MALGRSKARGRLSLTKTLTTSQRVNESMTTSIDNSCEGVFGTMSSSTGTFELSNLLTFLSDDNSDQTQETSHVRENNVDHVGEHNVDQEMETSHVGENNVDHVGEHNVDQEMETSHVGENNVDHVGEHNVDQEMEISHVREQNVDKEMVGLNIGKSSHTKQKRLRSDVWTKFEKFKDKDGNDLAKCSLCEKLFNGSSKNGTTHLRNHFRSCKKKRNEGGASGSGDKPAGNSVTDQQFNHLDKNHFKSCQNKRNEGEASGSGDKPVGNSVTDQQLNYLDWARTCIKQWYPGLPNLVGDADIINVYNEEKEKLRIYFEKLNCHFSLMIINTRDGKDTWFVVHFIDDDWKLEEKMIGFKCIEGDQNMKVLKNVLLDLGIDNKISSMVIDGDDSDIYVLSSDESENRFSGQGSLLSNCKFCVRDFSQIDMNCPDFDEEMDPVLYDHMSEIFNYIRETSSKNGTFQIAKDRARSLGKEVTAEDIPTEEEEGDMYRFDLDKIALGLKEVFFELENMDLHFKSINLTKEQWDVLTTFYQFCEEVDLDEIDWDVLDSETANMYFPVLCRLYKKSLVLVTLNPFISGERYLRFVKDAKKCWDQCHLILTVAAVLDPRFKMDMVEQWYKKIYGDEYETQLEIFRDYFNSIYNEYAKGTDNFQSSISYDISGNSSHDQDSGRSFNFELHLYLKDFPLIKDFDILKWWRLHSRNFPTLAKMARDFLSIKIKTYDYKFPSLYLFDTKEFDSDIVKEAFVCTKSWLTKEAFV
ncbi:hypothetical protein LWI29_015758 [Acer saccharum]|uniref:BED-type domain-containing protein n=1 Tax=Acer saccharum TaxID=4024 RepID=A0AA39SVF7_ACESA|nr:hypothetical protein LWI29_015758 [Acer saccharum]